MFREKYCEKCGVSDDGKVEMHPVTIIYYAKHDLGQFSNDIQIQGLICVACDNGPEVTTKGEKL